MTIRGGIGDNALTHEATVENSEPDRGYREDLIIPLPSGWTTAAGGQIVSGTTPGIVTADTHYTAISWDAGEGAAAHVERQFLMPRQWAEDQDDLVLLAWAKKIDAAADENPDLALQAQIRWIGPNDDEEQILTTPALATLAAASASGAVKDYDRYTLDLGARLKAENKQIEAGSLCLLMLGPDDTVGSTDMTLNLLATLLGIRRHAGYRRRADR